MRVPTADFLPVVKEVAALIRQFFFIGGMILTFSVAMICPGPGNSILSFRTRIFQRSTAGDPLQSNPEDDLSHRLCLNCCSRLGLEFTGKCGRGVIINCVHLEVFVLDH